MFHVKCRHRQRHQRPDRCGARSVPIIFTAGRTPITESGFKGSRAPASTGNKKCSIRPAWCASSAKWDLRAAQCRALEAVIDRASKVATTEPCGPVYLTLPREVMAQSMNGSPFTAKPRRGSHHARPDR